MILGMYRILGIASVLIGMQGAMQDYNDYENFSALRSVNMYSFLLPIFSLLYDAQLAKIISRCERVFNLYCKYIFVVFYWVLIVFVTILVLREPWKTVTIYKKVVQDPRAPIPNNSTESLEDSPFPEDPLADADSSSNSVAQEMTVRDLSDDTLSLLKIMNLMILFYPMMACAYSKAIFDCRGFSVP